MKILRIDVWSDIACPWCYLGKRRLEAALAKFPHREAVDLVWRAFELDPSAPRERERTPPYAARLAKKYATSVPEAEAMIARMTGVGAAEGIAFRFDVIRPGNTFDAHRVIHLARQRGRQDAVMERFFRGYMTEGEPIGDPATLARLAGEAGLDIDEVHATLGADAHASAVRADEDEARDLAVTGVPFFVLGGRYAIGGAQPAEQLLPALQRAWDDRASRPGASGDDAACDAETCTEA